jgi:hypothetical protein
VVNTAAGGAGAVTVRLAVAVFVTPSQVRVAVMVTLPCATPVTSPAALTRAFPASLVV